MFVCNNCGASSPKWMGKCSDCDAWNSFEERLEPKEKKRASKNRVPLPAVTIDNIQIGHIERISSGSKEFDRVLGGGFLRGSVVLLGGEPGIGKSTLLLQAASHITSILADNDPSVLYVCAEESLTQVAERAKRIGLSNRDVLISQEDKLEQIESLVETHKPKCIFIDSIQALRALEIGHLSGQGSHIKYAASICCEWAQRYNAIVVIVAHITKEGIIAGPKLIEHMVDTVLMFEKSKHSLRFLYAQKNRHGAVDEVGILHMKEDGLKDIADIGLFFLEERTKASPPGICVAATYEGTRPFLVELQALTVPAMNNNRVYSDRIDSRQVSRVGAVLERHLKIPLTNQNLYVNVAGGIRISEPGMELALALALYSAYYELSIPNSLCAIGELSLPGEVHSVENFAQRCRQAAEYGFTHILAPKRNVREGYGLGADAANKIEIIAIERLDDAVKAIKMIEPKN